MKKIGLGIAIILFGILFHFSLNWGMPYIDWLIGIIGLGFAISGFVGKDEK